MSTATRNRIDLDQLKLRAQGRWVEILERAGIDRDVLDGKHHPCPKCGGRDRFRMLEERVGAVFCAKCFSKENGDGLAALMWSRDCSFLEARDWLGDYLGLGGDGNGDYAASESLGALAALALSKGVSVESLETYGAKARGTSVEVPQYDPFGDRCSTCVLAHPGDKGKNVRGQEAGIYLPHVDGEVRRPLPGESWCLVEGFKDAAALAGLGYLAAGMPTNFLYAKFARLFSGVDVTLIPDRDKAGVEGAKRSNASLVDFARRVRLATLPAEFRETKGQDCRDVLRKPGGEKLLRAAIKDAKTLDEGGKPREFKRLERITASELATRQFNLNYLIDGFLVEGQPCVLGGPSKSMKTSVLMDLAISLVTADPFLGRFKVNAAQRVGFVSAESGLPTLAETYTRICRAKGVAPETLGSSLIISTTMPKVDSADGLEALAQFCVDDELTVLILDPAYLAFSGVSENAHNVFAMGTPLLALAERCAALGVTVIIAHHSRKFRADGAKYEPLDLEELSYAGWSEFARQWLLINRREKYEEGSGDHRIWLKAGGSAGHSSLWGMDIHEGQGDASTGRVWDVAILPARDVRDEADERKAVGRSQKAVQGREVAIQSVMDALEFFGGKPQSLKTIRIQASIGEDRCKMALQSLKQQGIVREALYHTADRIQPRPGGWQLIPENER